MTFLLKKWALWVGVGLLIVAGFVVWRWRAAAAALKATEEKLRDTIAREQDARASAERERALNSERVAAKVAHDLRALEVKQKIEQIQADHDAKVAAARTVVATDGSAAELVKARREKRAARRARFQ